MTLRDFVPSSRSKRRSLSKGIALKAAALEGLTPNVLSETLTSFLRLQSEIHSGWHTKHRAG